MSASVASTTFIRFSIRTEQRSVYVSSTPLLCLQKGTITVSFLYKVSCDQQKNKLKICKLRVTTANILRTLHKALGNIFWKCSRGTILEKKTDRVIPNWIISLEKWQIKKVIKKKLQNLFSFEYNGLKVKQSLEYPCMDKKLFENP